MGANDDQALIVHTKRNHNKREDHHHRRQRRPDEIYPVLDVTHVMRRDTSPEIVLETKVPPTRRLTRKDIMLTPLKMMN